MPFPHEPCHLCVVSRGSARAAPTPIPRQIDRLLGVREGPSFGSTLALGTAAPQKTSLAGGCCYPIGKTSPLTMRPPRLVRIGSDPPPLCATAADNGRII